MHFKRHHSSAAVRASLPLLYYVKELELIPGGTALAPGYPEGAALISSGPGEVNRMIATQMTSGPAASEAA